MFERFTDRARKVMALANQQAQALNHDYIGTEHILLGLVKEGTGVAAKVLGNFDVDLRKVRLEVEKLIKCGPDMVVMGKLPQTPRAKQVIQFAIEEARGLNHNYVGTEHILLGLLREGEGVAAQVLVSQGLQSERVRNEVLAVIGAEVGHQKPEVVPERQLLGNWDEAAVKRLSVLPLTDRAKRALAIANMEAKRFNHEYIGTEHILLGLINEGGGAAANVLRGLEVDFGSVRSEIEKLVKSGSNPAQMRQLPHTPRAKKVIEYASEEAGKLGQKFVGTEHILLGLLRERDGVAARVLMNLGLQLDQVSEEVLKKVADGAIKRLERREALVSYLGMFLDWLNNPNDPIARILVEMNVDLDEFRRRVKRLMDDNQRPE